MDINKILKKQILTFGKAFIALTLIFGTIESAMLMTSMNFEWFEIYLAFLRALPLGLACSITACLFDLACKITGRKNKKNNVLEENIAEIVFSISIVFLILKLIHVYGSGYTEIIILASEIAYLAVITALKRPILSKALNKKVNRIYEMIINYYSLFVFVFIITSLIIDNQLEQRKSSKINIISNKKPTTESPNIILITLDTLHADHLSLYGYSKRTSPNLDRFANKAIVFENAFSYTSWTSPSHASIFTGRYPIEFNRENTEEKKLAIPYSERTIAEILSDEGYVTAGFVGAPLLKATHGFDQGFYTYNDRISFFERGIRTTSIEERGKTSAEVNEDLLSWIDNNYNQKFFLFINYFDAHGPYDLGKKFRNRFMENPDISDEEIKEINSELVDYVETDSQLKPSEKTVQTAIGLYDTEIYNQDIEIKGLFEKLSELGLMKNTVIIIVGDHGEEFDDHGSFLHSFTLYDEVIRVPLIIYYPNSKPKRITKAVETLDIFATIMDISKATEQNKETDSFSLVPILEGQENYGRYDIFGYVESRRKNFLTIQKYLINWPWKLIISDNESTYQLNALYNLKNDPAEQENLFEVENYSNQKEEMIETLQTYR